MLLCLLPAFFIAGAIGQFVSGGAVLRYLGAKAPRPLAYGVASISGAILAVCSCTVLPLFASIYRRGAGLGPATAFLYSGPAINVLAMILTVRVLGLELGVARAVGAVLFAVIVGLLMAALFRREEAERQANGADPFAAAAADHGPRPGWQDATFLGTSSLSARTRWCPRRRSRPTRFSRRWGRRTCGRHVPARSRQRRARARS